MSSKLHSCACLSGGCLSPRTSRLKINLQFYHACGIINRDVVNIRPAALTPRAISSLFSILYRIATGALGESTGRACNASGPLLTFTGGFQLSYIKFPLPARDALHRRELSIRQLEVYLCLGSHCQWDTGDVYSWVTYAGMAREIGCSHTTVSRGVKHLRKIGLLVGGTGPHGTLIGFASRRYESAEDKRQKAARQGAVQSAVQESTGRWIPDEAATKRYLDELQSPPPPAPSPVERGGNGTGASRFENRREKAAFESTLSRVSKYGNGE